MFKLARKNYLREVFSGGSGCTGDCGQGRRCTCSSKSEEMSQAPYEHKTLRLVSIDQTSEAGAGDAPAVPIGKNPQVSLLIARHNYRTGKP